jgi:hypothetical protein
MDRTTKGRGKWNPFLSLSVIGILLSSASCDAGAFIVGPQAVPDDVVFSLSPSEMTLGVGESATISPTLTKSNGDPVNPRALKWESTNPAHATVDRDGVVTGVAAGNPAIIASSGKNADTTRIRVVDRDPQPGVKISPDTVVLKWLNATATLTAELRDDEGTVVAQPGLTWKSLNPDIAQTDDMGVISAKGVGVALIVATAACCDQADTSYARVYQAVDSVAVEPESVSLPPESSMQLEAVAMDRGGSAVEDAKFEFRSANESVARVSQEGVLTTQSFGTTTVTAASEGRSDDVAVSVRGAQPNEPAGFSTFAENDFASKWGNGGAGEVGYWIVRAGEDRITSASSPAGPVAGPGVIRAKFPAGTRPGTGPFTAIAWDGDGGLALGGRPQYERVYRRIVWQLEDFHRDGRWEGQGQTKILGFMGYGNTGGAGNEGFYLMDGGSSGNPVTTFSMRFVQQGESRGNYRVSGTFSVGVWYDWEEMFVMNDIGKENGEYHLWVNGQKRATYTDVEYRTANEPAGFFGWNNNPTWGGTGGDPKTRDDYILYDYLYLSGLRTR